MHVLELQQTQRVRGRKITREHGPRQAPCMSAPVSPPPLPVRVRGGTTSDVGPPLTQTGGQTASLTSECAISCVSGSIMPTCTTEAEGERVQHTRNNTAAKALLPRPLCSQPLAMQDQQSGAKNPVKGGQCSNPSPSSCWPHGCSL